MTKRKLLFALLLLAAGFEIVTFRLFFLMTDNDLAEAAASQGSYKLTVCEQRPDFFDVNGVPLTGTGRSYRALIVSSQAAALNVVPYLDGEAAAQFYERLENSGGIPFLLDVAEPLPDNTFIETIEIRERYGSMQLAAHTIGYLDGDGRGASGLEHSLEEYLGKNTVKTYLSTEVNARNAPSIGAQTKIYDSSDERGSVTLTLDARIQKFAEELADKSFKRGAIVVIDCETGEIRASVSRPSFDPNDLSAAIEANDTAFVDRVFSAFNVGSIFKPCVAAAALEAGVSKGFTYDCAGSIEIEGQTYACDSYTAHGEQDLRAALENSCNCFFVALGNKTGAAALYNTASALGFGNETRLWNGFETARGSLPSAALLSNAGELSNLCFGQGRLLASPAQIAAYTACIANGGTYRELSIIESIGGEAPLPTESRRAISEGTARFLRECMVSVVENGTGRNGAPLTVSAGGKTGTAETGYIGESGARAVIGWFTGFFPAAEPKYAVTVMVEDMGYGYLAAAPIFKQLADYIWCKGI